MAYVFNEPPRRNYGDALPEGDYMAVVIECGEPYVSQSGKDVVVVKLAIQPSGKHVYYRPWTGKTKDGEFRDKIAEFLLAFNRAPKPGSAPDWNSVLGAKGKCRLKIREYNGDEQNEVAWCYVPRQSTARAVPLPNEQLLIQQAALEKQAETNKRTSQQPEATDDIPF